MNFQPLLDASPAIQIHAYAAIAALLLGGFVLFRPKGDRLHRIGGRIWFALMLAVALSSFFIHTIRLWGPWSPIHLVSVGTVLSLGYGLWLIRRRVVIGHARAMKATYVGSLIVAGVFTFLPGRIMYEVFLEGPDPVAGAVVLAAMIAGGIGLFLIGRRGRAASPRRLPAPRSA
jgi:uncharacterized membrane protein